MLQGVMLPFATKPASTASRNGSSVDAERRRTTGRAVTDRRGPQRHGSHGRLGRYRFPAAQVIGHHRVWGAFAFWCPQLDAVITGTVNTDRVDRRPLLGAVVSALID
jgi:hypothetical protein